jgi:hypothetical protein
MGANRAGENYRRRIKRRKKNLQRRANVFYRVLDETIGTKARWDDEEFTSTHGSSPPGWADRSPSVLRLPRTSDAKVDRLIRAAVTISTCPRGLRQR